MNTKEAGIEGENAAIKYLEKLGYVILERNFSTKIGEIDIIAKDKNCLVFVEVKARENLRYGAPIESITPQKVRSIIRTAQWYLNRKNLHDVCCRFDVIEVLRGEVNHTPDAFDVTAGYRKF